MLAAGEVGLRRKTPPLAALCFEWGESQGRGRVAGVQAAEVWGGQARGDPALARGCGDGPVWRGCGG